MSTVEKKLYFLKLAIIKSSSTGASWKRIVSGMPKIVVGSDREISIGEGVVLHVQSSNGFVIGCFEKHDFYFIYFQQLSLKLTANWTSGSTPSPCKDVVHLS